MIEVAIPINNKHDYSLKCPVCNKIFQAVNGIAACPSCFNRAPHPSDLVWLTTSRKFYYSSWSGIHGS